MAHKQFTIEDIILIEKYFQSDIKISHIVEVMGKKQPVYDVINFFKAGRNSREYWQIRKEKQSNCGRKRIELCVEDEAHIEQLLRQDWTPDVICGRHQLEGNKPFPFSFSTLYRRIKEGQFNVKLLPMKGKRKSNGHKETRGKQAFTRNVAERQKDYPHVDKEFGHLEGDTIVGVKHKSAVVTLAERISKLIITVKPDGRRAIDIQRALDGVFQNIPSNLFKSIAFDNGKEFSNWKEIANEHDIDIYFCDPGTPSQRPLNEHSNGLLRRDGLPKEMDFNTVSEAFIQSVSTKRNLIPRKSLKYFTPLEVFLEKACEWAGQQINSSSLTKWIERAFVY